MEAFEHTESKDEPIQDVYPVSTEPIRTVDQAGSTLRCGVDRVQSNRGDCYKIGEPDEAVPFDPHTLPNLLFLHEFSR